MDFVEVEIDFIIAEIRTLKKALVGEKNVNQYVVEIVESDLRRIEANSWMLSLFGKGA